MILRIQVGANPEQIMQQTGIVEVNLGGFDLAFLEVCMPGQEHTHHEHVLQDIAIMPRSGLADP